MDEPRELNTENEPMTEDAVGEVIEEITAEAPIGEIITDEWIDELKRETEPTPEELSEELAIEEADEEIAEEATFEEPTEEITAEAPIGEIITDEWIDELKRETEASPEESVSEEPLPVEPLPEPPIREPEDPLHGAQTLPELFPQPPQQPQYAPPVPQAQQSEVPPTVVPRPKRKKHKAWRIVGCIVRSIFKWAIALLLAVAILAGGLLGYLTMTEYDPAFAEKARAGSKYINTVCSKKVLRVMTFNTGYGALGQDADFFMDGGKSVAPDSKDTVLKNMSGIERILSDYDTDFILLQEVDTDSDRSFEINQWLSYEKTLGPYESRFAPNYVCNFVPYPIGDFIGKVNSGIATFSRFDISSATRYRLPCPFSWPTRVANLKRCFLVTRIPTNKPEINGHQPELVLVNFHLEAYDDGEGKQAQTEQLMAFLQEEYQKGNYVVAGGDFNQRFPGSSAYPLLDEKNWAPGELSKLTAGWRYAFDDKIPTCRLLDRALDRNDPTTQYYVIDGFIVSPNVTINKVQTLNEDFVYSDHNPVILEFELK